MHRHTGEDPEIYQIRTQNQAKQDDWSKETQKKCPIKVIQTAMRARLSLWAHPCVYPHILYPFFFSPNKPFTCFTTFCLCGNSLLQSWRASVLSLTTALTAAARPQSLAGNRTLLQAAAGRGHQRSASASEVASYHFSRAALNNNQVIPELLKAIFYDLLC